MDHLWVILGSSMDYPCTIHGSPMDLPWIVTCICSATFHGVGVGASSCVWRCWCPRTTIRNILYNFAKAYNIEGGQQSESFFRKSEFSMNNAWIVNGWSIDCPWIIQGPSTVSDVCICLPLIEFSCISWHVLWVNCINRLTDSTHRLSMAMFIRLILFSVISYQLRDDAIAIN